MNCPKCNSPVGENEKFCFNCGAAFESPVVDEYVSAPAAQTVPEPAPVYQPSPAAPVQAPYAPAQQYNPYPQQYYAAPQQEYTEPYKPMSPWAYIGYNILFAIPLAGLIILLVFAFDNTYIARRNYARSFLIMMLIGLILSILTIVAMVVLGFSISDALNEIDYMM